MAKRKAKSPILAALKKAAGDEALAVEFLERHRWGSEPACPRCGSADVYQMKTKDGGREKNFRWRCRGCAEAGQKAMYTVRTGTVFEETRLSLRVWVYAFWRACASKKGISALQLSREMEITHKSALFVLRRIREGLGPKGPQRKLTGTVEVDETYGGGKPRFRGMGRTGRGTKKTPVVGMVERNGEVRFRVMERLTVKNLAEAIFENADLMSRLMTDELHPYLVIGAKFWGGHGRVKHSEREYSKPGTDVHSNTVESVFSLLKRGLMGTFHSVSKKHLPNYLNEFEFRHNTRKMDDGQRVVSAVRRMEGKRLTYRDSVDSPPWNRAT